MLAMYSILVAYFLDGEGDDFQAHLGQVGGAGGAHLLADHLRLFDDLLDGQLADDAAQVPFHDQSDQPLALVKRLAEKLLRGGEDAVAIVAHFKLCDGLDPDRDALVGVEVLLRRDVEGHQLQREGLRRARRSAAPTCRRR